MIYLGFVYVSLAINSCVSLATMGATKVTAGKATTKANAHAFNQIMSTLSTNPTLNKVMTNDIRHDIKSAIKKAKTKRWYLLGIIISTSFKNGFSLSHLRC